MFLNAHSLIERIVEAAPDRTPLFLVGGAARDVLLSRPLHDLDFVVLGDALNYARRLADNLGAAYYPMDVEHETARVILTTPGQPRLVVDIAAGRGDSLEADLRLRDFTINAIAIDPWQMEQIIDPLGGAVDLKTRRLRVCSDRSFSNDPNRILRAVRLATVFKMQIEPDTRRLLREATPMLPEVSPERIRDEIFRMLEGPRPAIALRSMDFLGILPYVFPELVNLKGVEQSSPHVYDVWEHTLSVINRLEELLAILGPEYSEDGAGSLALGLAVLRLGRYRQQISEHLAKTYNPDRSRRGILFFAALYHDVAKPSTHLVDDNGRVRFFEHDEKGASMAAHRASALRLSNDEIDTVRLIVRHHMRPFLISDHAQNLPTRRAIYRFFKAASSAGVEVCLHSLADFWGTRGPGLDQESWAAHLEVIRTLFESYWDQKASVVMPPMLLSGSDLIQNFNLVPGRKIGELLEAIREAQAEGIITNQADALAYAKNLLND